MPEQDFGAVRNRVDNARTTRDTITKGDMDLTAGAPNSREKVASLQFDRPHGIIPDRPVSLALMAFEQFTAAGAAPETFNLSHDLVDSGATDQSVIVYVNDAEADPASVDYDGDTVSVNTAANDEVGIFYAAGDQAQIEVQKTAPNGTHETLWSGDIGLIHLRDHGKEPIRFNLREYWAPLIPHDWTLDIYVKAPYTVRWAKDVGGDGTDEVASNALLGIQARQGTETIDGLKNAVRVNAAER